MGSLSFYFLSLLRSIIPIGSIIAWPTASIPTYGRGVWLECNGQSFSRTQFPQLYETLGTNRVPDYQGMFLRGYGSQAYYQVNGGLENSNDSRGKYGDSAPYRYGINVKTKTLHESGNIGQIQGDATRDFHFGAEYALNAISDEFVNLGTDAGGQDWFYRNKINCYGATLWATNSDSYFNTIFFPISLPYHVKYEPIMQTETIGGGEDSPGTTITYVAGLNEIHEPWVAEVEYRAKNNMVWTAQEQHGYTTLPTDNEIRPANVAVKFMIKAK